MAKKKERKGRKETPQEELEFIGSKYKDGILALIFFVGAAFALLSAFNLAGIAGQLVSEYGTYLLGATFYGLPLVGALLGGAMIRTSGRRRLFEIMSGVVMTLCTAGIIDIAFGEIQGGVLGSLIGSPLVQLFDVYLSIIGLGALGIGALLYLYETSLSFEATRALISRLRNKGEETGEPHIEGEYQEDEDEADEEDKNEKAPTLVPTSAAPKKEKELKIAQPPKEEANYVIPEISGAAYVFPPVSLLDGDRGKPGVGDIKANANIIKRTLANFGIDVEMDEISIGPTITRYALKPAEGVKLTRIIALQDNLSLALAAHPLRIEAPIPGKSLVGIEIPNSVKAVVGLGSLVGSREFQESPNPLLVALGRGTSGSSHFANIAKAPHLLIAGTTGSGKSVGIHTIVTSLLYRNGPDNLRFIMVDPKRVELTLYNNIPHLLTPVITDPKKAIMALKWATKEMDRRYNILETNSVRDIQSYHKNVAAPAGAGEPMPYIVVIIDELADMMTTYPREIESLIVRLAQMSRAVGIHLILSTQRPSVEVITGLIKANIPSRIAFQVPSLIDSRTIIDMPGAEKLLGSGDMLYLGGDMSKPQRIQSAYISETEVKKVVEHIVTTYEGPSAEELALAKPENSPAQIFTNDFNADADGDGENDDLYEDAREVVMRAGKASTSYLQRRLKVGYARAARLMDMLEERGVVGPGEGAKPREVLERWPEDGTAGGEPIDDNHEAA